MEHKKLKALIIEDDDGFFFVLERVINRIEESEFTISRTSTLGSGCNALQENEYSVVLLDLSLPDAERLDTLEKIKEYTAVCPIIVLTALSDKEMGPLALRYGMEDYLAKDTISEEILSRSIRYAIERFNLRKTINEMKIKQEMESIEFISEQQDPENLAAQVEDLKVRDLKLFESSVHNYTQILEKALDRRIHGNNHDIPATIKTLATTLAKNNAVPRDLIKIHASALKNQLSQCPKAKGQAYMEESRLISLELMGHLALNYRANAFSQKEKLTHL